MEQSQRPQHQRLVLEQRVLEQRMVLVLEHQRPMLVSLQQDGIFSFSAVRSVLANSPTTTVYCYHYCYYYYYHHYYY
jgi:hypothetical protein